MKRWIFAAVVLGVASGCDQTTFSEKKVEAQKRWFNTRSRVLCRIAQNRLSSGQLDSAAEAARQAIVLQPDCRDAKLLLVRVDIEQGRYAVAIERLKAIQKGERPSSELAYLLGVAHEKKRELEEALAEYRRAYALDESNLPAIKAAAEVLVAMGDVRRAQLHVDSYLPKAGEDPGMYELAGRLTMMCQEYDRAVAHYQRARDLDPENLRYMEVLARAQHAAGRYAEVADTLGELLGRKQYEAGAWVHMMLGDSYLARGEPHRAFDTYFTASEKAPDQPAVWSALARSALAMGDTSRTVLAANRALRLEPDQLEATLLLGYALLREKQVDQAIGMLTKATETHPQSPMVRCLLGRAHAANGNDAEAIRCYTTALRLDPSSTLARELLSSASAARISKADAVP
jgi:tetratricopeptide (TPR) repeat protein